MAFIDLTLDELRAELRVYLRDTNSKRWKVDSDLDMFLVHGVNQWSGEVPFPTSVTVTNAGNEYQKPEDCAQVWSAYGYFESESYMQHVKPGTLEAGVWRTDSEPVVILDEYPNAGYYYLPYAPTGDFTLYYGALHPRLSSEQGLSLNANRAWGEFAVIAYSAYLAHNPAAAARAGLEQWADRQDLKVDNPLEQEGARWLAVYESVMAKHARKGSIQFEIVGSR